MSFQWTLVASFLYAEIFVCLLFCFSFISCKRWNSLFKSRLFNFVVTNGNVVFIVIISVLVLLFMDALREVRKYTMPDSKSLDLSNNVNTQDHFMMMMFRAQRNLYISGFALFLFIVLRRLCKLIGAVANLEAMNEASMKQAESATRAAQELLDGANQRDDEDSEQSKEMKEQIAELKQKLAEARECEREAQADLGAMKSQAEATNREYDRLMAEHENLQNQLANGDGGRKDK